MVSSRSILNFTDITLCSIRFWLGLSWVCVEPQDEHSLQRTRLSMKLFVKTIWGQLIELKTSVFCVVFKSMFRSIFFILFRSVFFSSAFLHILFRSFRTIYESNGLRMWATHPTSFNSIYNHNLKMCVDFFVASVTGAAAAATTAQELPFSLHFVLFRFTCFQYISRQQQQQQHSIHSTSTD